MNIKAFIIVTLVSISSLSFSACNIEFSGFDLDFNKGRNKRANRMIMRKLKKKGYSFSSKKKFDYKLSLGEYQICGEETDSGIFDKYPIAIGGDFQNFETGEKIDLEIWEEVGIIGEITNVRFRKMVNKAINKIPRCKN